MSRSRKDGRRRGGHRDTRHREVWSRRCRTVSMWARSDPDYKRITHRHERAAAKREITRWLAVAEPVSPGPVVQTRVIGIDKQSLGKQSLGGI